MNTVSVYLFINYITYDHTVAIFKPFVFNDIISVFQSLQLICVKWSFWDIVVKLLRHLLKQHLGVENDLIMKCQ